jgi:amino acid transporter
VDLANRAPAGNASFTKRAIELLFGRPIPSGEEQHEQIGTAAGVPVLGLDALSSAVYGPEAALTVLIPVGAAGLLYTTPISLFIIALLVIVALSYRQTIAAYPEGGGSYTVVKENLGPRWGLAAGAALSIDYTLNVAVGISSGVGALCSAEPSLLPHTLALCLGLLALLTVLNLRGLREVGRAFMLPTYVFLACLFTAVAIGFAKSIVYHGHPIPLEPLPRPPSASEAVTPWLLIRAFAAGCTALTGVEAVSNGVPIFKPPKVVHAQRTLAAIVGLLVALLAAIAYLSRAYGIAATPPGVSGYESVLSQLLRAVAGRGWFYDVSIGVIVTVVALSANTSFTDFPRVCRLLAVDDYLPPRFARRGRRLVYTDGILSLTFLSAVLLIVFRGITDRLIPLFAVGAFMAFTLSQAGMVVHWRRHSSKTASRGAALVANAVGALCTGVTLIIIIVSKFREGAWLILILLPCVILLLRKMQARYLRVDLLAAAHDELDLAGAEPMIVVVPLSSWTIAAAKAVRFAIRLSPDVTALEVQSEDSGPNDLSSRWSQLVEAPARKAGVPPPRMVLLPSPYRRLIEPIVSHVHALIRGNPTRTVAVVIPELVERRWYHSVVAPATLLRWRLIITGGPQLIVIRAPWYVD